MKLMKEKEIYVAPQCEAFEVVSENSVLQASVLDFGDGGDLVN